MDFKEKSDWQNGDKVPASDFNRIESGLAFAINKVIANATLNEGWVAGDAVGLEFNKIGNMVIASFSASLTDVSGMHLFLGTIPEGMRPSNVIPFPAVFVPTSTTDYEARVMVINPDGSIMIAKNQSVTGTFFCAMVYFV